MDKTSPAPQEKGHPVPDSLIEMHCARQAWEESILDQIEEAHAASDVDKVMSLLTIFFTQGPGTIKDKNDQTRP